MLSQLRIIKNRTMKKEKIKKPPLGLRPKWIVDELRLKEIKEAIKRYISEGMEIPIEWVTEYNELAKNSVQ
jgi:hypothetical protein